MKTVRGEIEPLLNGMGFHIVELVIGRLKGATRVGLVVYRASGVGIEECAEISRLIFPRLQIMEGMEEVSLEVSSPGIERTLKSTVEYGIFLGRGVRILAAGETEWIGGAIEKTDTEGVTLITDGRPRRFPFSSIRKARLYHKEDKEQGNAV
jgi:ribosome maturation factor RimP